jgi:SPX domain protein involved in polyphosphate accumulation
LCVQTDIYTEWRDYYLDYTKLKKFLKEGTLYSNWNAQREKQFLELLESELEKIQGFQQSKVCNEFTQGRSAD